MVFYFFLIPFLGTIYAQRIKYKNNFVPPLDIPLLLSGNFGELRATHFHTGIDIKTQQVIGKNVISIDDGYVSRIKVQDGGYGKALYITHPGGFVSVYAHLSEYIPEIASYVKKSQYAKRSYEVDLYLSKNKFVVKKGQIVGKSGNTGRSSGPHLHFEIRDERTEIPINGLHFGFSIEDNIAPIIHHLYVYSIQSGNISNPHRKVFKPIKKGSKYSLNNDTIYVSGKTAFGIESYDYLNNVPNKCAPYSIQLIINDTTYYLHEMDRVGFHELKYIKAHVDYTERMQSKRSVHKLFIEPNNELSIYKLIINRGIKEFRVDSLYKIKIIVNDAYNNQSELLFFIKGRNNIYTNNHINDLNRNLDSRDFKYNKINIFETKDMKISIPSKSLIHDIDFLYERIEGDNNIYSNIHVIHKETEPLLNSYSLSIKEKNLPVNLKNKALIVSSNRKGEKDAYTSFYSNGNVTCKTSSFGKYFITVDTIEPTIQSINFIPNRKYNYNDTIRFLISDDLSGINSYNGYINQKWALFEYDAKNNLLFYAIDKNKLTIAGEYSIELYISDKKNNVGIFKGKFELL